MPLSGMVRAHEGGPNIPVFDVEAARLARVLARPVAQGLLHEDGAFCAAMLHAAERPYRCPPELLPGFVLAVLREFVGEWRVARGVAFHEVGRLVWPLVVRRLPGPEVVAAADRWNAARGRPLTESEVLEECRRLGWISARQRGRRDATRG